MGVTPPPHHLDWLGTTPPPGQDRMGVPHVRTGWGYPCQDWMGVPLPGQQHSEYLLRSGWYASYVHAGGLSCIYLFAQKIESQVYTFCGQTLSGNDCL